MLLSCYAATAFAVAGIHAFFLLRDPARRLPPRRARDRARRGGGWRRCCSRSPATSRPGTLAGTSRSSWPRWRGTSRPRAARRCASAASPTRTPGDPLRHRDPVRPLAARLPRPGRRGEGAPRLPARAVWPNPLHVHLAFQVMVGARARAWRCVAALGAPSCPGAAGALPDPALAPRAPWPLAGPAGFLAPSRRAGWSPSGGASRSRSGGCMRTADSVTPVARPGRPVLAASSRSTSSSAW